MNIILNTINSFFLLLVILSTNLLAQQFTEQANIFRSLDNKQKDFLDFVLSKYIETGVSELAQEKLPSLLELKYYSITDAAEQLGGVDKIKNTFISFQKYLYEIKAA